MKRIIIVGASYAGLYTLKTLSKNQELEVLIFDKNPYHYAQVESYGLAAGIYEKNDVTLSIEKYVNKFTNNINFLHEEISSFNSNLKKIYTQDNKEYSFDYLVIATGSLTNFPKQIKNLKKYSHGIKTLSNALAIKDEFKNILKVNNKIVNNYNIVIAGAGLAGVELSAEMASLLKKNDKPKLNITITLIDGMNTILPNMDKRLIEVSEKRLIDLGINILLGSFIKEIDEEKINLENGRTLLYDKFIFTGGIKAVNINSQKEYKLNKINQYITDEYLHLLNEKNIFVVGDVAEIIYKNKYLVPSAQLAIQSGEYVSRYIQNEIENKDQEKFVPNSKGILISLGGTYAVGLLFNKLFIKGILAYYLKKFTTTSHKKKFL